MLEYTGGKEMCPKAEIKHRGPFTLRTITRNSEASKRVVHPRDGKPSFSGPILTSEAAREGACPTLSFHVMIYTFIVNYIQNQFLATAGPRVECTVRSSLPLYPLLRHISSVRNFASCFYFPTYRRVSQEISSVQDF
jgi:hypothetical protein